MKIVNADDFGYSTSINHAIIQAFKNGLIQRTTIMVNMPYCDEAVELAKQYNIWDKIGLHLNLTEGIPLTEEIKQCKRLCTSGHFNRGNNSFVRLHKLSPIEQQALSKEIDAQIQKFFTLGFTLKHIDSHHHIHVEYQIYNLLKPLVENFESMRIPRNMLPFSLKNILIIIYRIKMIREINKNFKHTVFFDSYRNYRLSGKAPESVEIMVHPIIHNNVLYDRTKQGMIPMNDYQF